MSQNQLLRPLLPSLLILLLAAVACGFSDKLTGQWSMAVTWLPYALSLVGIWLAVQFSKRQLLLSVVVTLAAYVFIQFYLQRPITEPLVRYVYTVMILGLPLALLFNQLAAERGLSHPGALTLYSLYILGFLLAVACYQIKGPALVASLDQYFAPHSYNAMVISRNGLLLSLALVIISFIAFMVRRGTIVAGLFCVTLANLVPLYFLDVPYISSIFASAAMAIALLTGIKNSHDLAYRDALTGLNGRRKLFERLAGLSRHYSLAMLDIDHFKSFNDNYGHDVGDDVLAMVASKITEVGGGGEVFRYGGEEFTLIFPGLSVAEAKAYLDEVRELIANTPFIIRDKKQRKKGNAEQRGRGTNKTKAVQITVSIGVSEKDKDKGLEQAEPIIKAADKALYKAKKSGRNCVVAG
ncbi:GGDEF domain-containing protein [Gallaecimonas mangrovi]|uniref:GGDEF domain-containing protein n=1 Tax=Gallaecimonas mangrovi TaxID=2291597 RepID=UPI000E204E61|nr:GGDEF domain-containing protein [Gallaecimonas mangrovi]